MGYASRDHVYTLALSAEAFVRRARPVDPVNVDGTSGTIRLEAHGLTGNDALTFEVTSGGTLPTGISAFTVYYPIVVSQDLFKVATSQGGTPLTFGSVGKGWSIKVDQGRRLDRHIAEASAWVDQHMTAHAPPLVPDSVTYGTDLYPLQVVGLVARRAARNFVTSTVFESDQYRFAVDALNAQREADDDMLESMASDGWPIHPRPKDQTEEPDNSAMAAADRTPLDWQTGTI